MVGFDTVIIQVKTQLSQTVDEFLVLLVEPLRSSKSYYTLQEHLTFARLS